MHKHIIICVLILTSTVTSAQATTIEYVGPEFQFQSNTRLIGERVTARVTFSTPLTPGTVLTLADTTSFTLSAAGRVMTDMTASFASAQFYIGATGLPSDWGLVAEQDLEGGSAPEQIATVSLSTGTSFGPINGQFYSDILFVDDSRPNEVGASANGIVGRANGIIDTSWAAVTVPEQTTLTLVVIGVLAYFSVVRRNGVVLLAPSPSRPKSRCRSR